MVNNFQGVPDKGKLILIMFSVIVAFILDYIL